MLESPLVQLALILVLGVAAQWLAARTRLPAILLLLLTGLLAGPVTGWVRPEDRLVLPFAAVAVSLIVYESGLTLKRSELREAGVAVGRLCTVGALLTWLVATLFARLIFGLELRAATLLGATLVVTGPAVIGPLLHDIRPSGPVGPILKWEGIVLDPIGVVLAVLTLKIVTVPADAPLAETLLALGRTVSAGAGLGLAAAALLTLLLQRYWIPDFLQNAVSLVLIVAVSTLADLLEPAAGLLSAAVLGLSLANQRWVDVRHVVEIKESLRVLLIAVLLIVLAAGIRADDLRAVVGPGALYVAVLVLLARPLAVLVAALGTSLHWRERIFLMCVAPRGIIAAAVSALFALHLAQADVPSARLLMPIVFTVIVGTVIVYGVCAPRVAHRIGVAVRDPQGLLIVGAQAWARALAHTLRAHGVPVLLVDNNRHKIAASRDEGLPTYSGSILADYALGEINLGGLGRLLAATPNDWVNTLAVQRFTRVFGATACYQLPPRKDAEPHPSEHGPLPGRWLFGEEFTYAELARRFGEGAAIKAFPLTEPYDPLQFQENHGGRAVPLCFLAPDRRLTVLTAEPAPLPRAGDTLIAMVPPAPARVPQRSN